MGAFGIFGFIILKKKEAVNRYRKFFPNIINFIKHWIFLKEMPMFFIFSENLSAISIQPIGG